MNRIRQLRRSKGMTQASLAKKLNVAQNTISTWETEKIRVDSCSLQQLSALFGVSIGYLLGDLEAVAPALPKKKITHVNIAFLRKQKKISQQILADAIGVARSTLAMWETGGAEPDIGNIKRLAEYFNVSVAQVLGTEELGMKYIKYFRVALGLSQQELASALCVNQTAVSQWERGASIPSTENLIKMAQKYNLSVDSLLGIHQVSGSSPIADSLPAIETFSCITVDDNAMEPRIVKGDILIVRQQSAVKSGDYIVLQDDEVVFVRQLHISDEGIMLLAHNTSVHQPTFYPFKKIEELPMKILGKVVELRAKFD